MSTTTSQPTTTYPKASINPSYLFDPKLSTPRAITIPSSPTVGILVNVAAATQTYDPELDLDAAGHGDLLNEEQHGLSGGTRGRVVASWKVLKIWAALVLLVVVVSEA